MKHSLILITFLIWSISGCSFLGFHSDPYGLEDNEEAEESATAEEGTYEEEDGEEMEEEEEEGGEKRGFFARMFSFGDDDEEDMDEEEDAEDYEDEGEERAEEEKPDDDQTYADMESYDDEDSQEDGDMESYDDESDEGPAAADADTESYYENPTPSSTSTKAVTKLISVKKIKTSPYRRSGFLVNAVYLARPGDTIESVSQKIYGQDRSGDLYSINPHFRSRPLKTGDKVYYPSPQRSNDSSQLLVYYEDIGLPPNYHSLERGQNIRTAARNLLGSPDSWKEIWAINPEIQSKGAAEQTVQLRYWDGSGGTPPPPPEPQEVAQAPEETFPEEPPQQLPEPSQDMGAAPIEPPPMEDFGDPLPNDTVSQPSKVGIVETIKKNRLLTIGLIAFIALLLLLIKKIIHKMRNPGDEFDYTKTSIDNNKISI